MLLVVTRRLKILGRLNRCNCIHHGGDARRMLQLHARCSRGGPGPVEDEEKRQGQAKQDGEHGHRRRITSNARVSLPGRFAGRDDSAYHSDSRRLDYSFPAPRKIPFSSMSVTAGKRCRRTCDESTRASPHSKPHRSAASAHVAGLFRGTNACPSALNDRALTQIRMLQWSALQVMALIDGVAESKAIARDWAQICSGAWCRWQQARARDAPATRCASPSRISWALQNPERAVGQFARLRLRGRADFVPASRTPPQPTTSTSLIAHWP